MVDTLYEQPLIILVIQQELNQYPHQVVWEGWLDTQQDEKQNLPKEASCLMTV